MIHRILKIALASFAFGFLLLTITGVGCDIFDPSGSSARETPELQADAAQLRTTTVSSCLETPIRPNASVIWCGTFQLAWNELCAVAGGPVQVEPPVPEIVANLNRREFRGSDLDAESYVALAGSVSEGIYSQIENAIDQKFHGNAKPKHLPKPDPLAKLVAFAYLFKRLDFATPFERFDDPLAFGAKRAASFGMMEGKPGHGQMARQVSILDYQSEDDFVIELKTRSVADRLILAKIAAGATLAETVAAVQKRIASEQGEAALPTDVLQVPRMNFDISRSYDELLRLRIVPTSARMGTDLTPLNASQDIWFVMDEKGVILRSEAHMSFGCAVEVSPRPTHRMVFDKPFLIQLIRTGSTKPYFACWIGDGEILAGAK